MKLVQIFIICSLFFTSALSDGQKANPEPVSNAEQEYKNEINSLRKELENVRKDQSTIQQEHKHMSESIQKLEKLVKQFETLNDQAKQSQTLNDQVKQLQNDIGEMKKTDTEINKELNKVSQTVTDGIKKLDEKISKQISGFKSQLDKGVHEAKSQAKTLEMKIQEMEKASFLNVASQSLSNAYEASSTYVRSVDWSRLSDPVFWNNFREYSADSYENSKQFVYEQLIPAFQKQAIGQYNHARVLFNNLYTQVHKHDLFHRALKESKPYLVMANVPPQYHEYALDGVIALLFIINLFILYLFFLLFCGLFCPRVRKESSTDDSAKRDKNDDDDKNDVPKTKSKSTPIPDENDNTSTSASTSTSTSTNTKEKKDLDIRR